MFDFFIFYLRQRGKRQGAELPKVTPTATRLNTYY